MSSPSHENIGGDPVCWLNRVCENCGRFIGDEFADRCEHCGAARYDDAGTDASTDAQTATRASIPE